ncbi:Centromere protein C [Colletotrichum sidae]|uniref:CENP-C homolog n=1 Tax=Colletotrichum sidae TaxID=1347389 RepID=A0A4R8TGZ7_9PEZI|nr:Centromere protein C [Colletotrichum sidae]
MAPRQSNVRRRETSTGDFHELGVRGRKTGVELPDTGVRDEHGMQPIDGLFSSPEKDQESPDSDKSTGEQDMEIDSDTGAGPATILKNHPRLIPRGTSPRKTNLSSPAVRHPSFGVSSSPNRGSPYRGSPPESHSQPVRGASVSRKLDYGALEKNGPGLNGKRPNGFVGRAPSPAYEVEDETEQIDAPVENGDEESMQMVGMNGNDHTETDVDVPEVSEAAEESVEEVEEVPKPPPKRKGRPAKAPKPAEPEEPAAEPEKPAPKKRGRQPKDKGKAKAMEPLREEPAEESEESEQEVSAPKRRRGRSSDGNDEEPRETDDRASKRQRTESSEPKPKEAKPGKRGRPKAASREKEPYEKEPQEKEPHARVSDEKEPQEEVAEESPKQAEKPKPRGRPARKPQAAAGDDSILGAVQKGPPMPKARGLVSQKKKQDPHAITQTRSGRHSFRPLAFWKNEHVVHDDEAFEAGKKDKFLLPSIKEVIRVEEEEREVRKAKAKNRKGAKGKRRQVESEDEEELEPWEQDPGSVEGEIVVWQPEHEFNPPAINDQVEIDEDRIAVAAGAIQTRDIRDATFRFAKTLSLPFFGSGVVDLPPGAEKRPKNSRKMQMVFFVFQGKVLVTVHETQFRIGAGGMWFVPRGNYYSITNDYENPARIFFAQGCELSSSATGTPGPSQDMTIMG